MTRKKVVEKCLDKFFEEHKELFDSLANDIRCPNCDEFVKPPFYNLGEKYNSFEGCKDCYEKTKKEIK